MELVVGQPHAHEAVGHQPPEAQRADCHGRGACRHLGDAQGAGSQTTYATGKTGTGLQDQLSILVDIGGNINLIGPRAAIAFREAARAHGYMLKVMDLSRPHLRQWGRLGSRKVQQVGKAQHCDSI